MRMKFNKSGQLLLVSAASLLVAGLVTACGTLTVDFVFVASSRAAGTNNYGEIDVFEVDSESGHMRPIPTSPFPSGGRNPVSEAVSADNTNLYVVNQDDNTIVQFIIGNDGKLYPQNTTDTPGIFPLAVAVNGSNLFVVDAYQPLPICSTAAPCSGSIAVYPIQAATSTGSDALGSPVANGALTYWPLSLPGKPNDVLEPTAINVPPSGAFLYVAAYDTTAHDSYIFGFWITPSNSATVPTNATCPAVPTGSTTNPAGTLCPLNGGAPLAGGPFASGACPSAYLSAPYVAGTCPAALASDSTSGYLYVTDSANARVHAYSVASSGLLAEISGSPFAAGNQPSAIIADTKYPYLYVANSLDSTVTAYSISSGALTFLGTYTTGTQPVAIGIDPSTNHFLYTVNYLGNNVSGFELSSTAGTLLNAQNSPFTANAQPTAVAAIPHGSGLK
jgi:6-phosphogluconolactonase (cycloisomerase 2 family)